MASPRERLRIFIRGCLIGYAVIIAGFLCIRVGMHAVATRTTAAIVGFRAVSGGGGVSRTYGASVSYGESPVVAYKLDGNDKLIENDDVGFFDGPYNMGDSISVFYYPWTKDEAKLYNFKNYWLNISTIMVLIIVLMAWTGVNNIINMKDDEEIKIPIDPIP